MLKSISVWALPDNGGRTAESLFSDAREHGFDAIELAIGLKGLVTPESTETDCRRLVEVAAAHGLKVSSLASGLGWQFPLSADDESVRAKGIKMVAAACGRPRGWA